MRAGVYDGGLDEPRQPEAHQDIEHVGPDRVWHRHVAVALLDDGERGERVRHRHASRHERQAHHRVRDTQRVASLMAGEVIGWFSPLKKKKFVIIEDNKNYKMAAV